MNARRRGSLLAGSLMLLVVWVQPSAGQLGRGLTRSQRQTTTSELATGLTGTGISFNSLYGDPYLQQQQQNVFNSPYDWSEGFPNRRDPALSSASYDSTLGQYDGRGTNSVALGGFAGARQPVWSGFGQGKGYGRRARYPATSGLKY